MAYRYLERESKNLEFKVGLTKFHNLIKTCVAFANGIGGKLIIGVEDSSREVVGVDEKTRQRIYAEFPNSLYDATEPSLLAEVYEKAFDGKNVIVIRIAQSNKKPVFIKSEGMPKGVYLRAGPNTRRATAEHVHELMRENKRLSYDEEIVNTDVNVLKKQELRAVFKKYNTKKLLTEKIVATTNANHAQIYPTITGILYFCDAPQMHITEASIRITRLRGISGREIIQTEEINGNLETQAEVSLNLVRSWLLRDFQLQGTKLVGKLIVPEVAIRESIVNALIHRKYSIPGAIKIALYDNRLEIFSPGNFPGLVDVANLGDGITYLRNPNIARIARRIGMAENLGAGIKLIYTSCEKAGLQQPEFVEGADSVKVIFWFNPRINNHMSDEEKILNLVKQRDCVTIREIMQYLAVGKNTATRRLKPLLEAGKIIKVGKGPATRYCWQG